MTAVLLRLLLSVALIASGTTPVVGGHAAAAFGLAGHASHASARCHVAPGSAAHAEHAEHAHDNASGFAGSPRATHACCDTGGPAASSGCCGHDGMCSSRCAHSAPLMLTDGAIPASGFAPAPVLVGAGTFHAGPDLARLIRPPIA